MNRLCAVGLLLSGLPFQLTAQIAGRINGHAVDPSGATIANVRLVLTATDTRVSRTGMTGADGFYEFADVLPGKYTLAAETTGFQKQLISNITVEVAQVLRQDVNLVLGATTERVEVMASAVALQTEDSQVGGIVETKAVNDLPLNGRDFTQLMVLLPGASEGSPTGTTGKHYVERVAGLSFSVNGPAIQLQPVSDRRLHGQRGAKRNRRGQPDYRLAAGVSGAEQQLLGAVRHRSRRAGQYRAQIGHKRSARNTMGVYSQQRFRCQRLL